ncbi:hypothetical protein AVEN_238384-1 [Araneus ventricosus]|uniref:Uncharacterized protein n=1 Tax=Araneus ventricosus TaxID=182803 RepID=A0A4Y2DQ80_ARAVE|nr:hypothetical protein AVEN_238384-1 [Araneus ventricosus]
MSLGGRNMKSTKSCFHILSRIDLVLFESNALQIKINHGVKGWVSMAGDLRRRYPFSGNPESTRMRRQLGSGMEGVAPNHFHSESVLLSTVVLWREKQIADEVPRGW